MRRLRDWFAHRWRTKLGVLFAIEPAASAVVGAVRRLWHLVGVGGDVEFLATTLPQWISETIQFLDFPTVVSSFLAFVAISLVVWDRIFASPSIEPEPIHRIAPTLETPATPIPATQQPSPRVTRRSSVDRERISQILYRLHDILHSDGEGVCDFGSDLEGSWKWRIDEHGPKQFANQLVEFGQKFGGVVSSIHDLIEEEDYYRSNVQHLVNPKGYQEKVRDGTHAFAKAVGRLPEGPSDDLLGLVEPQHCEFVAGVRAAHEWVRGSKKKLINARQELEVQT